MLASLGQSLLSLVLFPLFFSLDATPSTKTESVAVTRNVTSIIKPFYKELYGIRLGQYREVPIAEYGKPIAKDRFEDGYEYEAFLVKPDSSVYMVFEYAVGHTEKIWSVQITGKDGNQELGLEGLRFGLDKTELEKRFGPPTSKEDVGEYGQRWQYENSNLSFEVNTKGKLSSIKIQDNSEELFPIQDLKKLPSFEQVRQILTSGNNALIAQLLSPDMELYVKDKTYFFHKSFQHEVANDDSKVYSLIKDLSPDLRKINTKDTLAYEENIRVIVGQPSKYVMKFGKGNRIKELVFQYYFGEYLIWEIKTS